MPHAVPRIPGGAVRALLIDYARRVRSFSPAARVFLLGEFFGGIGQGSFWVLRNLYLKDAGLSESAIGNLLSVTQIGALAVAVPMAFRMDRTALKGFLILGALAEGAGLAGVALWPSAWPLIGSCLLVGVAQSLLGVGSAPFLARHSEPEERPYLIGVSTALAPASGLVGTALVGSLSAVWGEGLLALRGMLLVSAAMSAAGALAFLGLRERPPCAAPRGADAVDRSVAWRLCIPGALTGLGAGLSIPFINLYFRDRFGHGSAEVGALFSVAQGVTFLAFLAAPVAARRWGSVSTIVGCQMLSIPFFLAMAATGHAGVAAVSFLGRHALMNMAHPVNTSFAMDAAPPGQRVRVNAFREVSWSAMWVVATSLGGWMIQHTRIVRDGYETCMAVTIVLYVTASLLFRRFWMTVTPSATSTPTTAGPAIPPADGSDR